MKLRVFLSLLINLSFILVMFSSVNAEDINESFRGIKWLTPKQELLDAGFEKGGWGLINPDDNKSIGDIPLQNLYYYTRENPLIDNRSPTNREKAKKYIGKFNAVIMFFSGGQTNNMADVISNKFGEPDRKEAFKYYWNLEKVAIELRKGYVWIVYFGSTEKGGGF